MSACNCCEQLPIDVVTLEFRATDLLLFKCGFIETDESGCAELGAIIYQQKVTTYQAEEPTYPGPYTVTETIVYNSETGDCDYVRDPSTDEPPYDDLAGVPFTTTYGSEYTTAALMVNAGNRIESQEFSGEWQDAAIGPQENHYSYSEYFEYIEDDCYPGAWASERKIQIRIAHPPTATGYLKVWLWKRTRVFDPQANTVEPPEDSAFEIYEWQGVPASDDYSVDAVENRIEFEYDVLERPAQNTSVQIVVAKWSLIPEYEPSDPIANGETYELERPSPDCESNGVPTLNEDCPLRE
jgi:hypothetical protein